MGRVYNYLGEGSFRPLNRCFPSCRPLPRLTASRLLQWKDSKFECNMIFLEIAFSKVYFRKKGNYKPLPRFRQPTSSSEERIWISYSAWCLPKFYTLLSAKILYSDVCQKIILCWMSLEYYTPLDVDVCQKSFPKTHLQTKIKMPRLRCDQIQIEERFKIWILHSARCLLTSPSLSWGQGWYFCSFVKGR